MIIPFFSELGKRSSPNIVPRLVYFHIWARSILTAHGVPFMGIVANSEDLDNHITCQCFDPILDTPLTTNSDYNTDDPGELKLDISGNLFESDTEVFIIMKTHNHFT